MLMPFLYEKKGVMFTCRDSIVDPSPDGVLLEGVHVVLLVEVPQELRLHQHGAHHAKQPHEAQWSEYCEQTYIVILVNLYQLYPSLIKLVTDMTSSKKIIIKNNKTCSTH